MQYASWMGSHRGPFATLPSSSALTGRRLCSCSCVWGGAVWCVVVAVDVQMVDTDNADIADQPPHGHASAQALEYAPIVIGKYIHELASWELQTVAVMCGQGLVEHVDYIDQKLKAVRPPISSRRRLARYSTFSLCELSTHREFDRLWSATVAGLRGTLRADHRRALLRVELDTCERGRRSATSSAWG